MLCDICIELGMDNCVNCELGNPCLGCKDYDEEATTCKSEGGCGVMRMAMPQPQKERIE